MDRYLKRKEREELDINNLPSDPGLRPSIWSYDVNDRDQVRRSYLAKGPHQPKTHNFPQTNFGNTSRRFNPKWFEEYPHWLEYSIQKDSAYCLYCYLFKAQEQTSTAQGGGDSFIIIVLQLLCVACLSPFDSFSAFDRVKLVRLAQLYPTDFSTVELATLNYQLGTYIIDMRTSADFLSLSCISDLAKEMVKTKKNGAYPLVYRLIILALTLPVATATVERAFSAMKIVKNRLRGQMGDDWLHDCLVPYIEKDVFELVPNEVIMQYYQSMQNRLKSL